MANCALAIKYRHLNFLSAPLVVLALVDEKLAVEERQELGKKVSEIASIHWDDRMLIAPVESPQLQEERFWQVHLMKGCSVMHVYYTCITEVIPNYVSICYRQKSIHIGLNTVCGLQCPLAVAIENITPRYQVFIC